MNKTVRLILQFLLIGVAGLFIVLAFREHPDTITRIQSFPPAALALLVILLAVSYLLHAWSVYAILLNGGLKGMGPWSWYQFFVISRFLNFHVTQGANIYRVTVLKKNYGFPISRYISFAAFFMWWMMFLTLLISTGTLYAAEVMSGLTISRTTLVLALSVAAIGIAPFLLARFPIPGWIPGHEWLRAKGSDVMSEFLRHGRNKKLLTTLSAIILITFILQILMVHITLASLGEDPVLFQSTLYSIVLYIGKFLNVLPGNIGLIEALCGQIALQHNQPAATGILAGGLLHGIEYLFVAASSIAFSRSFWPAAKESSEIRPE